jgi:DNA-binding NtrC family response regulator
MPKKKSEKILIVGDNPQIFCAAVKRTTVGKQKPIKVSSCEEAIKVASRHPSYFDLLFTDISNYKVNNEDFAKQFNQLTPKTRVVYLIL